MIFLKTALDSKVKKGKKRKKKSAALTKSGSITMVGKRVKAIMKNDSVHSVLAVLVLMKTMATQRMTRALSPSL